MVGFPPHSRSCDNGLKPDLRFTNLRKSTQRILVPPNSFRNPFNLSNSDLTAPSIVAILGRSHQWNQKNKTYPVYPRHGRVYEQSGKRADISPEAGRTRDRGCEDR